MRRGIYTLFIVAVMALQVPLLAWAQAGGGGREIARERFLQGVELIEQERWEEGLAEFEESYRAYPTQAALFNRALCLRLLRRYGEALAILAEYRTRYSAEVSEDRMAEVNAELHTIQNLIGRLTVTLEGASAAEVLVDGESAGTAPTASPIVVAPGRHNVEVRSAGYTPYRHSITISSGDQMTIRASLSRAVTNALLEIQVNVPGAQVSVDGSEIGATPIPEPLPVVAGNHTVEVTRPGYRRAELAVSVAANGSATANVVLQPITPLPGSLSGELELRVSEDDAEVYLDGQRWLEGPLPIGPHNLEVRQEGFENHRQEIEINQGQTTHLDITLVPGVSTPVGPQGERNRPMMLAGIISGGVGIVLAGVAVGLTAWNSGRSSDWSQENGVLQTAMVTLRTDTRCTPYTEDCPINRDEVFQRIETNNQLLDDIETIDTVSYVLYAIGGAAIAAGVPLLILGMRRRPVETSVGFRFNAAPTRGGMLMGASLSF